MLTSGRDSIRNLSGEDLLDPVRERVAREVAAPPILIASRLGPDAHAYGALYIALQTLTARPH
jgi:hypothetical protein